MDHLVRISPDSAFYVAWGEESKIGFTELKRQVSFNKIEVLHSLLWSAIISNRLLL